MARSRPTVAERNTLEHQLASAKREYDDLHELLARREQQLAEQTREYENAVDVLGSIDREAKALSDCVLAIQRMIPQGSEQVGSGSNLRSDYSWSSTPGQRDDIRRLLLTLADRFGVDLVSAPAPEPTVPGRVAATLHEISSTLGDLAYSVDTAG